MYLKSDWALLCLQRLASVMEVIWDAISPVCLSLDSFIHDKVIKAQHRELLWWTTSQHSLSFVAKSPPLMTVIMCLARVGNLSSVLCWLDDGGKQLIIHFFPFDFSPEPLFLYAGEVCSLSQHHTSHSRVRTPSRPSIQPYNLPAAENHWLLWQLQEERVFRFSQFWQWGCTPTHKSHRHVMAHAALLLQPMDVDLWWWRQLWLVTGNHPIIKWRVFIWVQLSCSGWKRTHMCTVRGMANMDEEGKFSEVAKWQKQKELN